MDGDTRDMESAHWQRRYWDSIKETRNLQVENAALKAVVAKLDSEATDLANEILNLKAENELNLAANRGLGRLVDGLQAENERLQQKNQSLQDAINITWQR